MKQIANKLRYDICKDKLVKAIEWMNENSAGVSQEKREQAYERLQQLLENTESTYGELTGKEKENERIEIKRLAEEITKIKNS